MCGNLFIMRCFHNTDILVPCTTANTYTIAANKGASFTLTGGSSGSGCGTVTVKFVKSTGKTDAVDCLVEVHGVDV